MSIEFRALKNGEVQINRVWLDPVEKSQREEIWRVSPERARALMGELADAVAAADRATQQLRFQQLEEKKKRLASLEAEIAQLKRELRSGALDLGAVAS